jgi:DNA-binding response OmpR family regulator
MSRPILLAEDNLRVAREIKDALEQRVHEVVWIVGIQEMPNSEGFVQGIAADQTIIYFRFTDFAAALVDYSLQGDHDGDKIIAEMKKLGANTCAISTDGDVNEILVQDYGATTSCIKLMVVRRLDTILASLLS